MRDIFLSVKWNRMEGWYYSEIKPCDRMLTGLCAARLENHYRINTVISFKNRVCEVLYLEETKQQCLLIKEY